MQKAYYLVCNQMSFMKNVHVVLEDGDFIAMMTDGVTETRTEEGFIDEDLIKEILESVKDESAQKIADTVYQRLGRDAKLHLHDDFTIVIFKKRQ